MDYIEIQIQFDENEEFLSDLLAECFAEIGFETFLFENDVFSAYCPATIFDETALKNILKDFEYKSGITYTQNFIKAQNWNENWEKNYFEPIIIGDECVISSSFHKNVPQVRYNILIDPKMSFGTGHHETTSLMLQQMLSLDLIGKSVLDMGCGTAVLAILAAKKGASSALGIDIDQWAYHNSQENIRLNHTNDIQLMLGGAELLQGRRFDVIFANINRNILLADMASYAACLPTGGELFISGFYTEDIPVLKAEAERNGLNFVSFSEKNNWAAVRFVQVS